MIKGVGRGFVQYRNPKYFPIYINYKNRLKQEEDWKEESDDHVNKAAVRYIVKLFIKDLYPVWMEMEGFTPRVPYEEEYLNIIHNSNIYHQATGTE